MKRIAPLLFALSLVSAAHAQESTRQEGLSLMEKGAELFFQSLVDDLEPAINEFRALAEQFGPKMRDFMMEMGPQLSELIEKLDDIANYEAPEILPNGDIIIRRKPNAPALPDEIDL